MPEELFGAGGSEPDGGADDDYAVVEDVILFPECRRVFTVDAPPRIK
jgi:hypothetical protein